MDFFSVCEPMRGYRGSTIPIFRIPVTGMDLTGCSMEMLLERRYTPGRIVFSKACAHYTSGDETGYTVQLTSADTAELSGAYTMYYVLTDSGGMKYYNLLGYIEFLDPPREVT